MLEENIATNFWPLNKRIVLITLLIILFSAGIYIYKEYNRKPARLNNLPAVVNINADTLISQFALNEAEANKKYLGKEIYIAFIEDDIIKVYYHDEVVNSLAGSILETESWNINGNYSWPKTPNLYKDLITKLND